MKKRFAVTAAVIGASCAIVLSGCAGCAGCGQNSKNIASLNSNWYANTNYKKIQPTFTEGNDVLFQKEALEYTVTFNKPASANKTYSVEYSAGTYVTEFYAKAFNKDIYCCEEFKGSYPDKLTVYYYKTQLDIPTVTFTMGSETKSFDGDKMTTECFFMPVENYLRPLYSKITVKSTTPAMNQPKDLESAYKELDYEYTTYYNYNCTAVKTIVNDGKTTNEKVSESVKDAQNSVFDTAALNIVARASKLGDSLSQAISLYTPTAGLESFTLANAAAALSDSEKSALQTLLKDNGLYKAEFDGDGKEKGLATNSVNVIYGGQLTGVTQTYWFAAIDNPNNNTGRTTMVKLATPLPFGLGTLNYTLSKINQRIY